MSLFEFIKDAGSKIFADETPAPPQGRSPEELRAEIARKRSQAIQKRLEALELSFEGLEVEVDGDKVRLTGEVADQETREKAVLAAGNIAGVASVEDRLEVAHPTLKASFYSVKPGDTLSKIAKTFYGDPMKYPVIFEANRPMLENPDRIFPGQMLRIPPPENP